MFNVVHFLQRRKTYSIFCEQIAEILYICTAWLLFDILIMWPENNIMSISHPVWDCHVEKMSHPVWIFHLAIIIWKTRGILDDQSTAFTPIDHVDTTWCASCAETRMLHSHITTMTIQLQQWTSVDRKHARMSMVFVYTRCQRQH